MIHFLLSSLLFLPNQGIVPECISCRRAAYSEFGKPFFAKRTQFIELVVLSHKELSLL